MQLDVPLVTLDVSVLNPGLFRQRFKQRKFPRTGRWCAAGNHQPGAVAGGDMSAVLLVEYSAETFALQLDALRSCFYFMRTLAPDDWTAVVLFDKRPRIIQDFTQDRTVLQNTLQTMVCPLHAE
jgi:hypothetical protein